MPAAHRHARPGRSWPRTAALPAGQIHTAPDSNAWAANGPKVAGGGAMLAGDPHLLQTLPSIWYEVALQAPGLQVSGVSVPGLPGVLIGHNAHIAWSITNAQNQSALFYAEQTSSRAGQGSTSGAGSGAGCGCCTTRSRSAAARPSS